MDVPAVACAERRGPSRIVNAVLVAPTLCITARIEVGRYRSELADDDTAAAERVDPVVQRRDVDRTLGRERSDLAAGVHARVGAAGGRAGGGAARRVEPYLLAEDRRQRRLEGALNRGTVWLDLPAEVFGAVVLDDHRQAHGRR